MAQGGALSLLSPGLCALYGFGGLQAPARALDVVLAQVLVVVKGSSDVVVKEAEALSQTAQSSSGGGLEQRQVLQTTQEVKQNLNIVHFSVFVCV